MGNCVASVATCLLVYSQHMPRIVSVRCRLCRPPREQQSWEGLELCLRSCDSFLSPCMSRRVLLPCSPTLRAMPSLYWYYAMRRVVQFWIRCHKLPFVAGQHQRPFAPGMAFLFPNRGCLCVIAISAPSAINLMVAPVPGSTHCGCAVCGSLPARLLHAAVYHAAPCGYSCTSKYATYF